MRHANEIGTYLVCRNRPKLRMDKNPVYIQCGVRVLAKICGVANSIRISDFTEGTILVGMSK